MMETQTGRITELNDEVLDRIKRIQANAQFLKAVGYSEMTPRKQRQLLHTGHTKIGRNAPCPCGSTKTGPDNQIIRLKFKNCCLDKPQDRLILDAARDAMKSYA